MLLETARVATEGLARNACVATCNQVEACIAECDSERAVTERKRRALAAQAQLIRRYPPSFHAPSCRTLRERFLDACTSSGVASDEECSVLAQQFETYYERQ